MNTLISLPDIMILMLELIIFISYMFLYSTMYEKMVELIDETMLYESSNDYFNLMKIVGSILLTAVGISFVLVSAKLSFISIIIEFIIFGIATVFHLNSTKLLSALVSLKYGHDVEEYYCLFGSVEKVNNHWTFEYTLKDIIRIF